MAAATAPSATLEPPQARRSQPAPYPVNPPCNDAENKDNTIILKVFCSLTALYGPIFNGFAAAGILSEANKILATNINPAYNSDYVDFWWCMYFLFGISAVSGIGSKPTWLIGNVILCSLTFASCFARTGDHLVILRTLIGLLLAVMLATAERLVLSSFLLGLMSKKLFVIHTGLSLSVGPLLAYAFGIVLCAKLSWQGAFFIIAAIDAVLLMLSISYLPTEQEWRQRLLLLTILEHMFVGSWREVVTVVYCFGQLAYTIA